MNPPLIHWCWPEPLELCDGLRSILESLGRLSVSEDLPAGDSHAEILVPRLSHEVNPAALSRFPSLRIIATPSTGTDHIDLVHARERGISVLSLRGDTDFLETLQSTAELAWLLVMTCARRFRSANRMAMSGHWDQSAVRGTELFGKTIGIVGLGRLGKMVARFAQGFRMRILATDVRPVTMDGVECVGMDELLQNSDILSIHVHLDESTRGLIGRREFGLMKPGAILVNTSRGAVLDESALLEALQSGRLSAAGLDVLCGERDENLPAHPLIVYARQHDHLILTPHVGGCTLEAQTRAFLHIARKIAEHWKSLSTQQEQHG